MWANNDHTRGTRLFTESTSSRAALRPIAEGAGNGERWGWWGREVICWRGKLSRIGSEQVKCNWRGMPNPWGGEGNPVADESRALNT